MEQNKLTQSVNNSEIPPLHHKRILAFVNNFLINSSTFLNDFAANCEGKFIELERSLQKVEAALTIVEAKLDSIPWEQNNSTRDLSVPTVIPLSGNGTKHPKSIEDADENVEETPANTITARTDERYNVFFKMLHVGVPADAVKLKLKAAGLDVDFFELALKNPAV